MGMYDSVLATCPNCGVLMEFQSKSGPCDLKRYNSMSVPADVAADIVGEGGYGGECRCGRIFALIGVLPRIKLDLIEMKKDEDGDLIPVSGEWD